MFTALGAPDTFPTVTVKVVSPSGASKGTCTVIAVAVAESTGAVRPAIATVGEVPKFAPLTIATAPGDCGPGAKLAPFTMPEISGAAAGDAASGSICSTK